MHKAGRSVIPSSVPYAVWADRFIGVWDGTLLVNEQTKIPTVIKISKLTSSRKASFDIPGEGVKDKPFKTLGLLGKSSHFLACPTDNPWITLRATTIIGIAIASKMAQTRRPVSVDARSLTPQQCFTVSIRRQSVIQLRRASTGDFSRREKAGYWRSANTTVTNIKSRSLNCENATTRLFSGEGESEGEKEMN